jgi:hypothetical protein
MPRCNPFCGIYESKTVYLGRIEGLDLPDMQDNRFILSAHGSHYTANRNRSERMLAFKEPQDAI